MLKKTLAVLLVAFGMPWQAVGDQDGMMVSDWDVVTAGPAPAWSAPLCGGGRLLIQPFFFFTRTRGVFDADGHFAALGGDASKTQNQQVLFTQAGLSDRWELDAQVAWVENAIRAGEAQASAQGLGDAYVWGRYCFRDDEGDWPCVSGLAQVKVPTGKYQDADPAKMGADLFGAGSGGGSWDFGLGLIATKKWKPLILHADAIANLPRPVQVDGLETQYGAYLNYDVAVEWVFLPGWNAVFEANGFAQSEKQVAGSRLPGSGVHMLAATVGLGWSSEALQTLLAWQRTLLGMNAEAADTLLLSAAHTF